MAGQIFISYRRDDDPAFAARVRDGLAARFRKASVFMDIDNLLAGQRFDEELAKALASCDVLIAVIGARWMELLRAKTAAGERDYVREEIGEALKRRIVVIAVRVGRDGQLPALPRPDELPEDIREFVQHQKHDVAHERFGRDIAELGDAIAAVRRLRAAPSRMGHVPWGWIGATAATVLAIAYVAAYAAGIPVWWPGAPAPPDNTLVSAQRLAAAETARRTAEIEAKRKAEEAERQGVAAEQAEAERRRVEAAKKQAEETERQRVAAVRAEELRKRAAELEAKRRADFAEQQRAAAEQAESERKRAESAKRQAEEAERKRVAAAKAASVVAVASKPNFSVAGASQRRLLIALVGLDKSVADALRDVDLDAVSKAGAAGFEPPGDDELDLAIASGTGRAIDNIKVGYPDLAGPILLLTVAERNELLSVTAYLVHDNDARQKVLQRVDRQIRAVKDVTDDLIANTWSACIAASVKRYLTKDSEAPKPECLEQPRQRLGPQVVGGKASVQPQKPDQSAGGPAAGNAQVASNQAGPPPAAPATLPPPASAAPPASLTQRPSGSVPQVLGTQYGSKASTDPLAGTKSISPKLLEAVLGYGLPWMAGKEKLALIRPIFTEMVERSGGVGSCLQSFGRVIAGSSRPNLEDWMIDELWRGQLSTIKASPPAGQFRRYIVEVEVPDVNSNDFVSGCVKPMQPLKFSARFASRKINEGTSKKPVWKTVEVGQFTYSDARKRLEAEDGVTREDPRLPIGVEAFALAQVLVLERFQKVRFWMELDAGRPAIFHTERNTSNQLIMADYKEVDPKGNESAVLVAVFGPLPPL